MCNLKILFPLFLITRLFPGISASILVPHKPQLGHLLIGDSLLSQVLASGANLPPKKESVVEDKNVNAQQLLLELFGQNFHPPHNRRLGGGGSFFGKSKKCRPFPLHHRGRRKKPSFFRKVWGIFLPRYRQRRKTIPLCYEDILNALGGAGGSSKAGSRALDNINIHINNIPQATTTTTTSTTTPSPVWTPPEHEYEPGKKFYPHDPHYEDVINSLNQLKILKMWKEYYENVQPLATNAPKPEPQDLPIIPPIDNKIRSLYKNEKKFLVAPLNEFKPIPDDYNVPEPK